MLIHPLCELDRKTRETALSHLIAFLTSPTTAASLPFSPNLLKVWKALFYTVHHTDRPLPQQRLARQTLSQDLLLKLPREVFVRFLAAFWKTMIGAWGDLQGLRLDKYLFLMRCYIRGSFDFLERSVTQGQDQGLAEEWCDMMTGKGEWEGKGVAVLDPQDPKVPDGLRYHVLDVWVDGLQECASPAEVRGKVMDVVELVAKKGSTKVLRERAKAVLSDERLSEQQGTVADEAPVVSRVGESEIEEEEFNGFND